ncbi:MAG TPA: hypothetical protein VIY28_08900 [Pseudonocardiaceae bacterium]
MHRRAAIRRLGLPADLPSVGTMTQALLEAGAPVEGGGTALRHAAVFGMTDVLDVLVAAGATIHDVAEAAAVGDLTRWLTPEMPLPDRVYALRLAAGHERLAVIDQLLAAGSPSTGWTRTGPPRSTRLPATEGGERAAPPVLRGRSRPT